MPDEKKKLRAIATVVPPKSQVMDYSAPSFVSVRTEVNADSPDFIPEGRDNVYLKANLGERDSIILGEDELVEIDCGFFIKLPSNYRAVISSLKQSGLTVTTFSLADWCFTKCRVTFLAMNNTHKKLTIKNKQPVAIMNVQPRYGFEWI
jgi:hypothetical protein